MSVRLGPYPEYKDSGVPWLGEIPKHWRVLPNRALFAEVNDRNHADEPMLSVTIGDGIIRQSDLLANGSKKDSANDNKANYKLVLPHDIAYNKMRAWQSAVGVSKYRGIVSPAYIVVRQRGDYNPSYFHYLLRTPAFAKEAERWSYGITSDQWSLRAEDFKQIYCSLPPKEEQENIVGFLAHSDRSISRLLRAKRRLIELLNEQKQAIIHRAVTRGLDPTVRLKPSGVAWLGDVPQHWEVRRLKTLSRMRSGESITGLSIEPTGAYPVYGGNGVRGFTAAYTHEGEYALIGRQGALCGNVHFARGRFWASEHAVVALLSGGHDLGWFGGLLTVMNLNQYSMAAAQPGLAVERVLNLWAPVPPADEQKRIAEHIRYETAAIVSAIDRAHREIALLCEYRTRLIADVVTGKLDVRGVELPALDEADVLDDVDSVDDTEPEEMSNNEEAAGGNQE